MMPKTEPNWPDPIEHLMILGRAENWRKTEAGYIWVGTGTPIELIVTAIEAILRESSERTRYHRTAIGLQISKTEYWRSGYESAQRLLDSFCELADAPGDPLEAMFRFERQKDLLQSAENDLFQARELYQTSIELCREAERYINYPEPSFFDFVRIVRRWAEENRALIDGNEPFGASTEMEEK